MKLVSVTICILVGLTVLKVTESAIDVDPWDESDEIAKAEELGKWSMYQMKKYTLLNGIHKLQRVKNVYKQLTEDEDVINWKFEADILVDTTVNCIFLKECFRFIFRFEI
jgi:hypothetical protein